MGFALDNEIMLYSGLLCSFTVFFLVLTTSLSQASVRCSDLLSEPIIASSSQSFDSLDSMVQKWILSRQSELDGVSFHFAKGETVIVGNKTAEILHLLGRGSEGEVYLSRFDGRLAVIKRFFDQNELQQALNNDMLNFRYDYPRVLASSRTRQLVIMEYFEGLPVQTVFNPKEARGLGLSNDQVLRVTELWSSLNQWYSIYGKYKLKPENVIYSIKLDRLLIIDHF